MMKKKPLIKGSFYNNEEKIKKCCCTNVAQQQIRAKKDLERSLIYQGFWLLGTSNFTRL